MLNAIEREQLCITASSALHRGTGSLSRFPDLLRRIIEEEAWKRRQVKGRRIVELNNLAELITKKPLDGWGEDPRKVEAIIKDDPELLQMYHAAITGKHGTNQYTKVESDNITIHSERGTSKAYTLRRLKNQRPDLFKLVVAGELSANAAAIEAGFRKVPTQLDVLKRTWKKATARERIEFLSWMEQQ